MIWKAMKKPMPSTSSEVYQSVITAEMTKASLKCAGKCCDEEEFDNVTKKDITINKC